MKLEYDGREIASDANQPSIESHLTQLASSGDAFIILSKDDMNYIQACKNGNDYVMEYQAGSWEEHYHCVKPLISLDDLKKAFNSYLVDSEVWHTDFDWAPMESVETGGKSARSKLPLLFVSLGAGIAIALFVIISLAK